MAGADYVISLNCVISVTEQHQAQGAVEPISELPITPTQETPAKTPLYRLGYNKVKAKLES